MNKLTLVALSFSLPFLSACTPSMPTLPDMPNLLPDMSLPTLYKDDVQQGSVLTRFKINQLRVGMSKAQVQDLIGSPSIIDPFHSNQWDYINHTTRHEQDDVHYRLALKFTQEKLATIDSSGIVSLAKMTDKEKVLEEKYLIEEKEKIEAEKQAKIKAEQLKKVQEAKRVEDEKLAAEKAQAQAKVKVEALKNNIKLEQTKQKQVEAPKVIKAQQPKQEILIKKEQQPIETPWYKFWLD